MCPICRGEDVMPLDDLRLCQPCNHIFQADLKANVIYGATYLRTYDNYPIAEMTCLRLGYLKAHLKRGRLLDVGCGSGALVKSACDAGYDAFGHDIHDVEIGIRRKPLVGPDRWDLVTFYDSLEHFENFDAVRSVAGRAKTIVISLPCRPEWFPKDRTWKHYKPGEHLHYFSLESLSTLFSGHRLERVTDVEDIVRKGSSGQTNITTATFCSKLM